MTQEMQRRRKILWSEIEKELTAHPDYYKYMKKYGAHAAVRPDRVEGYNTAQKHEPRVKLTFSGNKTMTIKIHCPASFNTARLGEIILAIIPNHVRDVLDSKLFSLVMRCAKNVSDKYAFGANFYIKYDTRLRDGMVVRYLIKRWIKRNVPDIASYAKEIHDAIIMAYQDDEARKDFIKRQMSRCRFAFRNNVVKSLKNGIEPQELKEIIDKTVTEEVMES